MIKTKTQNEIIRIICCDVCGVEAKTWELRVKKCEICKKDICSKCAIQTDFWMLEDGSFQGDYPDHFCLDCWEKGKDIRENILKCRDNESKLWNEWHKLGANNEG